MWIYRPMASVVQTRERQVDQKWIHPEPQGQLVCHRPKNGWRWIQQEKPLERDGLYSVATADEMVSRAAGSVASSSRTEKRLEVMTAGEATRGGCCCVETTADESICDNRDHFLVTADGKAWTADTLSSPKARIRETLSWESDSFAINFLGIRKLEDVWFHFAKSSAVKVRGRHNCIGDVWVAASNDCKAATLFCEADSCEGPA